MIYTSFQIFLAFSSRECIAVYNYYITCLNNSLLLVEISSNHKTIFLIEIRINKSPYYWNHELENFFIDSSTIHVLQLKFPNQSLILQLLALSQLCEFFFNITCNINRNVIKYFMSDLPQTSFIVQYRS